MSFIAKLLRLIFLFWICAFAVLIMTMWGANVALSQI